MIDTRDHVVLVTPENVPLGIMNKLEAHQKGVLHRAFSIFLFNDKKELLLQQRAAHKYHGAKLWTNTCCSHQQSGEDNLTAANNRLQFEMGIYCPLEEKFSFLYKAQVENNLIEHELDFILMGIYNDNPVINDTEVMDYKWIAIPELMKWIDANPEQFTYWFKEVLPSVLQQLELN